MEFDYRKPLIVAAILIAVGYYAHRHYGRKDVLAYMHAHQDVSLAPTVDYYAAMSYFIQDRHEESAAAFQQMLTDFPTCQYVEKGLLHMGESYEEVHNWDGAKEAYKQYLEQFPGGKDRHMVQTEYDMIKFK